MRLRSRAASLRRATVAVAATTLIVAACTDSEPPADEADAPPTAPADTTAPTTTARPATTPPITTSPITTAAAETTAPGTTATTTAPTLPAMSDAELHRFCLDVEQIYVADRVLDRLDQEPELIEAGVVRLLDAADTAIERAPEGFGAPARLRDVAAEAGPSDDLREQYASEFAEVRDFLSDPCASLFLVLDHQADKVAAVIDDMIAWPLAVQGNAAGDIRFFLPDDWDDSTGSFDLGEFGLFEASADLDAFKDAWNEPGVRAMVFYVEEGVAEPAGRFGVGMQGIDCETEVREDYADPVYSGELVLYDECGGVGAAGAELLVADDARSLEIVVGFRFPETVDRELVDQVLALFAAGF